MSLSELRNPTLIGHYLLDGDVTLKTLLSNYAARKLATNLTYKSNRYKK
jgi:hypothetical protein